MMDYKNLAEEILGNLGGTKNINSFTNCMTRLRVNVKDPALVNSQKIKEQKGVLGVVDGEQTQIVVGAGHAQRLREAFGEVSGMSGGSEINENLDNLEERTKEKVKSKQKSSFQRGLKHIGNIFIPLIPGFMGTGLVLAITRVWGFFDKGIVTNPWFMLLVAMGGLLLSSLNILVGYNAGKEFGGTPVLGAIAGAMIAMPALAGQPDNPLTLFNGYIKLSPNLGGILGVIFAAFVFAFIEKKLRKIVPASLDLFIIPVLTILIGGAVTLAIVMPVAAVVMKGITFILLDVMLNKGGIIGGYVLAAAFLPLVMLGIHQGLTPVHVQLIQDYGYTVLFPILGMAGAGQVGSAIAVLMKTKDKRLRELISSALPAGFLGIGEPLIYGVSLPLFYPFITACLGAGFGGAVLAGTKNVGSTVIGPSGLMLLTVADSGRSIMWCFIALVSSYLGGFILTYLFGYNEKMLERLED
jgi:PTS system sucrose-specific IIC component